MKLKNKETGEIVSLQGELTYDDKVRLLTHYNSLAELNEEWEDYEEPKGMQWVDVLGANDGRVVIQYPNEKEAEKAVERLRAWKRLKDKGFMITLQGCKGNAWLQANWGNLQGDYSDVLLLFGGEE